MSATPPPVPDAPDAPRADAEAVARATEQVDAVVRLAGGVAHDFNNLLTVISGNAQEILEDPESDGRHRDEVGEIAEAARRAATLTHQLLAFTRQAVLHPVPLDLDAVLGARWEELERAAGPGVRLHRVVGDAGRVSADAGLLYEAIEQLVRNAAEAMPRGGQVQVSVMDMDVSEELAQLRRPMSPGPYVLLRVRDDGVGMDAATRERAIEPFFTTKSQKHGAGMGLPTVYGIVKQSGGFLWLDSAPGQGTTCEVYLPRLSSTAAAVRIRTPVSGMTPLRDGIVLLVEDEELVRQLVRRTLLRMGYRVVEAPNAHRALEQVRREGVVPSLLLTDIVMPGMDGRELAAHLEREFPGLPVILMSGFVDPRVRMAVPGEGRRWFLEKPFALDQLRATVERAFPAAPDH